MLSLVAVACGGDTADDAAEAPDTTEAPKETLAAPATTAPPPEVILVWAEEKVAEALNPLVGAYEAAAGVDGGKPEKDHSSVVVGVGVSTAKDKANVLVPAPELKY